ncbi:MAG TPA: Mov34/MPN/PAD-1 family protein [Chloroflexota bacterium]|jgi:hypothetical protein
MPLPPTILVLHDVLEMIEHEIEAYRQSGIETGGVMIGAPIDKDTVLVLGATGPGPHAEHFGAEYALDVAYAQEQLMLYQRQYPTADYIGEWHRHPDSLPVPSGGDWQMAERILRDPSYRVDALINPIVVLPNSEFQIRFFYLHRLDLPRREPFQYIQFETISPADPRAANILGSESAQQQPEATAAARLWDRLASEQREIGERYHVSLSQPTSDGYVIDVALSSDGLDHVRLLCHRGYPYEPPDVWLQQRGERVAYTSSLLAGWSSRSRLIDIVDDARRRIEGRHSSPGSRGPSLTNWMDWGALAIITGRGSRSTAPVLQIALALVGLVLITTSVTLWLVQRGSDIQPNPAAASGGTKCADAWNVTQPPTAPPAGQPTGIRVQALDESDLNACRELSGVSDNVRASNVFVMSPVDARVRISALPQLLQVSARTVTSPSAPLQPGTYTVEVEDCPSGNVCSAAANLSGGGGLLVSVIAN